MSHTTIRSIVAGGRPWPKFTSAQFKAAKEHWLDISDTSGYPDLDLDDPGEDPGDIEEAAMLIFEMEIALYTTRVPGPVRMEELVKYLKSMGRPLDELATDKRMIEYGLKKIGREFKKIKRAP